MNKVLVIILACFSLCSKVGAQSQTKYEIPCYTNENKHSLRTAAVHLSEKYDKGIRGCETWRNERLYGQAGFGSTNTNGSFDEIIMEIDDNGDEHYFRYNEESGDWDIEVDSPENEGSNGWTVTPERRKFIEEYYKGCLLSAKGYFEEKSAEIATVFHFVEQLGCDHFVDVDISPSGALSIQIWDKSGVHDMYREWNEQDLEKMALYKVNLEEQIQLNPHFIVNVLEGILMEDNPSDNANDAAQAERNEPSTDRLESHPEYETISQLEKITDFIEENIGSSTATLEGLNEIAVSSDNENVLYIDTDLDGITDEVVTIHLDGSSTIESVESPILFPDGAQQQIPEGYVLESYPMDDGSEIVFLDRNNDGEVDYKVTHFPDGSNEQEDLTINSDGTDLSITQTEGTYVSDPNQEEPDDYLYAIDIPQAASNIGDAQGTQQSTPLSENQLPPHHSAQGQSENSQSETTGNLQNQPGTSPTLSPTSLYPVVDAAETFDINLGSIQIPIIRDVSINTLSKGYSLISGPIEATYNYWTSDGSESAQLELVGEVSGSMGKASGLPFGGLRGRTPKLIVDVFSVTSNRLFRALERQELSDDDYDSAFSNYYTGSDVKLAPGDIGLGRLDLIFKYGLFTGISKGAKLGYWVD